MDRLSQNKARLGTDTRRRTLRSQKPIGVFRFASFCDVLVSQGLLSDAHLFLLEDMVADFIALRSSSASASASGGGNGAGAAAAHEMHVAAEQMSQLLGYVRA